MAMNIYKLWISKTLWAGSIGLAAMLLGWAPPCKAQEVSPAIFTDTGVEDAYPVKKQAPKKLTKMQTATHPGPALSNKTLTRKQPRRDARKQNVVSAPIV